MKNQPGLRHVRFAFLLATLLTPVAWATALPAAPAMILQQDTVTLAEANQFGQDWETAVGQNKMEQAKALVDWSLIASRVIEPFDVSEEFRTGFMRGASQLHRQILNPMSQALDRGGSYRFVKIVQREGKYHAIFRLLLPGDGGLNYHQLRLNKKAGQVVADRFFVGISGETLAETMRSAVGPAAMAQSANKSNDALQKMNQLRQMSQAIREGQRDRVMEIYSQLDDETKRSKICMLYRLMAIDADRQPDAFVKAVDEYIQRFPNDPSLGLVTMDAAMLRGDAEFLKRAYNQLNNWVGGDDYLTLMVAGALVGIGSPQAGIELAGNTDPGPLKIADAHDYRLTVDLAKQDYPAVLKNLRILRDQFGLEIQDISKSENFAGFVQSPQYQQWLSDKK